MFCMKCGSQIEDGVKFCPVCGAVIEMEPKSAQPGAGAAGQESGAATPVAPVDQVPYGNPGYGQPYAQPQPEVQQAEPTYRVEDDEAGFTPTQRKLLIRTMAVISYLGAYLFFPMFAFKDKKWLRQHVNNGLVLLIFEVGFMSIMIIPFVGWVIGIAGLIMCVVLAIQGIIKSVKGQSFQMFWFFGKIKILK